jgi:uncharacterized OB-fold protein
MIAAKVAAIAMSAAALLGWSNSGIGEEEAQTKTYAVAHEEEAAVKREGTITGIHRDREKVSVQLNGFRHGIVLRLSEETKIVGEDSSELTAKDLVLGMEIEATHEPRVMKSLPPQATAKQIVVKKRLPSREVLGTAGTVESVAPYPDGTIRILVQGEKLTELSPSTVALIVRAETEIVSAQDNSRLSPKDLKPGMRVYAFYGPMLTRSIPPIGRAEKIVVE